MINVIIAGPRGKMGRAAVQMVQETERFQLVAVLDRKNGGKRLSDLEGFSGEKSDVPIYEDHEECFKTVKADVLIDLTTPEVGRIHTLAALSHGIRPVVGTTGFSDEDLEDLRTMTREKGIGCIIAPNFAIGAILMMKFAQNAAKYFSDVEILEMHHDQKLDAPSGTAIKTAQLISEERTAKKQGHPKEKETIEGARGADFEGMRIHSIRLPGLIAHQEVIFGGEGQTLTLRHDSYDRKSFMSGVRVSVDTVMNLDHLVYGLENILD
jgi:4-hydroxy-tetrahydrodipicolinate reductase